jgi:hypothetical protein
LSEPRLLHLIRDGAPAYAWPAEQRDVWNPPSRGWLTSVIESVTRPRNCGLELATA